MSDIKDWPNTAAGFNSLSIPDSAPENGTTVAQLNDVIREEQAATRRYYEEMEWREFGYGISTNSADTVTFSEAIPLFIVGQRVKVSHNTSVTSYGRITINSAQILTIDVDGGTTLVSVTAVAAGFSPTGDPAGLNGTTIDNTIIGGTTPVAITGTTIKANTSFEGAAGATITDFETTSTNSATKVPTSSAMETYADAAALAIADAISTTSPESTSNGSITFGGGTIIKFGYATGSGTSRSVTYATAFPTACYWANLTDYEAGDTSGQGTVSVLSTIPSTTGFTISTDDLPSSDRVYWIAIGI